MNMELYKVAVDFLIAHVEDFIDGTIPNYNLDNEFSKEIKNIKKRIEVVRKFEPQEERV